MGKCGDGPDLLAPGLGWMARLGPGRTYHPRATRVPRVGLVAKDQRRHHSPQHLRTLLPQTPRETSAHAFDPTFPAYELIQWLGIRLVRRRVPHHARPLASGQFVGLLRVSGAPDDGREGIFPVRDFQPT
jgi:hypothetical protein